MLPQRYVSPELAEEFRDEISFLKDLIVQIGKERRIQKLREGREYENLHSPERSSQESYREDK